MSTCFSFTEAKTGCYRWAFRRAGLRSSETDLRDGTVMHCWVPRTRTDGRPDLVLIHGLGVDAVWQWGDLVRRLAHHFNVYVPDLVFFGHSRSTSTDRTDAFQARCVMRAVEAHGVRRLSLVGLSYGGFVGYSMAAQFPDAVERVVICCSGVCMEEKDLREGLFRVSDLEEAASILIPQSPAKLRELMGYTLYKPPPLWLVPSCLLTDFIDVMCADYVEERRDLIRAIPKDRKFSELPKITQPTLIIWGEHDQIFPLELAYRLKRHLGDNAHLSVIKNAGHAFNVEKSKEFYKELKAFLVDLQPPLVKTTNYLPPPQLVEPRAEVRPHLSSSAQV